jgi:hypothetical protein
MNGRLAAINGRLAAITGSNGGSRPDYQGHPRSPSYPAR